MKVQIFQPTKTATQSGRNKIQQWKISFLHDGSYFIDPTMGWIGSKDMRQELNLTFTSKEAAIEFAKKNKLDYELIEPQQRKIIPKSYADNFR